MFLLKIPPTPRSVKYSCGMPLHLSAGWALKSGVSTQAPFAFRDGSPSTSVRAGSSERCSTRSHRLGHKACWLQESSESHFRLLLTGLQNAWLLGFSHLSVSRMIQVMLQGCQGMADYLLSFVRQQKLLLRAGSSHYSHAWVSGKIEGSFIASVMPQGLVLKRIAESSLRRMECTTKENSGGRGADLSLVTSNGKRNKAVWREVHRGH